MIDIASQIQLIIDNRFNHNKAAFARAVEISPTTLASYLNSKKASKPSSDFLCTVVEKLGIDAHWLLTGEGEMDRKPSKQSDTVNTYGANSPGKIVGNIKYNQQPDKINSSGKDTCNSNADEIIKELASIIKAQEQRIQQLTDKLLGI